MADSTNLRVRRARAHKRGNHTLCRPERCSLAGTAGEPAASDEEDTYLDDEPESDRGLGPRGQKLWDDLTASWEPSPLHREMLLEACRMADRLEKLDGHLKGREWLRFRVTDEEGTEVKVYVDGVLRAVRELQGEFRMAVADLVKAIPAKKQQERGGGKLASVIALAPSVPAAR